MGSLATALHDMQANQDQQHYNYTIVDAGEKNWESRQTPNSSLHGASELQSEISAGNAHFKWYSWADLTVMIHIFYGYPVSESVRHEIWSPACRRAQLSGPRRWILPGTHFLVLPLIQATGIKLDISF